MNNSKMPSWIKILKDTLQEGKKIRVWKTDGMEDSTECPPGYSVTLFL